MTIETNASRSLKQADASSYDANAAAFDHLTERYSASLAAHMIALGELGSSDTVLDVGSGTGLLALLAAARVQSGRVVGIDHSQTMLEYARAKADTRLIYRTGARCCFGSRELLGQGFSVVNRSFAIKVRMIVAAQHGCEVGAIARGQVG